MKKFLGLAVFLFSVNSIFAQARFATYRDGTKEPAQAVNSNVKLYAGIEVGSKGVKLTILEMAPDAKETGAYKVKKDSTINTDFISFTQQTYQATLAALNTFYDLAHDRYSISDKQIFTAISSGVKIQADKEEKQSWVEQLKNGYKLLHPNQNVTVIAVEDEARLSHLGIVPESRRFNTFLIDIGSGNTKGGYFPYGNTDYFKLFELTWGTKSASNAVSKIMGADNSMVNFNNYLERVLAGAEQNEIIYAVNASGSYPINDNVAFSGGIAWALATLMYPDLINDDVVPVSYEEVNKFYTRIQDKYSTLSDYYYLVKATEEKSEDAEAIGKMVKTVNKVFDQKALLSGAGLMLKIMRQFESVNARKNFYFVKNGSVGWISAFVQKSTAD